jgi:hypothetical protein
MLEIVFLAIGMLIVLFLMVLVRGFLSLRLYREWKNAAHVWKTDHHENDNEPT